MRTLTTLLGLAAIGATTGCEDRTLCEEAAALDQQLRLGTGFERFEPIEEGDVVAATYGGQGGQHLWLSVQTVGIDPGSSRPLSADVDVPLLEAELWTADGRLLGSFSSPDWIAWSGSVDQAEMVGEELLVDVWSISDRETGEPPAAPIPVVLSATVVDSCGSELTHEVGFFLEL